MKLYTVSFYNPFFVDVNGKPYEVANIKFFDADGIICETGRGWFGSNNSFRNGLEISVDVVLKKKVDFSLSVAFIIATGEKSFTNDKMRYALYIPAFAVGLKPPTIEKPKYTNRHFVITWKSDIKGVSVDKWHFVDSELSEIEHQITETANAIHNLYGDYITEKLPSYINELKQLDLKRQAELKKMDAIKETEILKEYTKRY